MHFWDEKPTFLSIIRALIESYFDCTVTSWFTGPPQVNKYKQQKAQKNAQGHFETPHTQTS